MVVAKITVGLSAGLTLEKDNCCPVHSSLHRFPEDCFVMALGMFVTCDWVLLHVTG